MRSLKGQGTQNVDQSDLVKFPHYRPKDASTGNNDGTPLVEKTVMTDTSYAFFKVIHEAGLVPDESPENIEDSQVFDAFMRLFGGVGEIVPMIGKPKWGRYLLLDGSIIDLTQKKYKYLKEWIDYNKVENPSLFIDQNVTDYYDDRGKFYLISSLPNSIGLPHLYAGDSLRSQGLVQGKLEALPLGSADFGVVQKHSHTVGDFQVNTPAHSHTLSVDNHAHTRGTMDITGATSGLSPTFNWPNAQATGAFSKNLAPVAVAPVVLGSAAGGGYGYGFAFQASKTWTGSSSTYQHSHTITSAIGGSSTVSGVTTNQNVTAGSTGEANRPSGITVNYYIKY